MDRTKKDFCDSISSLSTDFRIFGRNYSLPESLRKNCTRISIELFNLYEQLYSFTYIKNDEEILMLADKIKAAGDEANAINEKLNELTKSVEDIRKGVKKITKGIEIPSDVLDKIAEAESVLGKFGIDLE